MNITKTNIRVWSRLGMCGAYGQAMIDAQNLDDSIVACTADLCTYSGLDRYKKLYPHKLYNVGIAEQNLIGIAGGLAKEGYNPFASTYASFATTRALDQVKVNMGYMKLPIKLIGLTAGFSVGILGATHMAIEDIAIIRAIPNITIISPADTTETYKTIMALVGYKEPVYVRLTGTMMTPVVYSEDYEFEIGKSIVLREGTEAAIVAAGTMVARSLAAASMLECDGISVKVIDMHTIKPLDEMIMNELLKYKKIITVEEHSKIGGLGSALAEYISDKKESPQLLRIGIEDIFYHAGSYDFLLNKAGLTEKSIYKRIREFIKEEC